MRGQPASAAPLKQKYILDKDTKKNIIKAAEDAVELEKKKAKKDLTEIEINKIRNDTLKTELNKIFNGKKNVSPEEQGEILTNLINEINGVVVTKWLFAYDHLNPNRLKNILRNKVDGKRLNSIKEIYAQLNDWQLCFQGYDAEFKCSVANIKYRPTTNAKDPHFVTGIIYGLTDDEFDIVSKVINPEKDSIRNRIDFVPNIFRVMNEDRSSYNNTFNNTVYTFVINENSKIVTKGLTKPPEGISDMKGYFFEKTKGRDDTNQQGIGEKYLNEILETIKLSRLETEHKPLLLTIVDSDFKPRYEIEADYVYVDKHEWRPVALVTKEKGKPATQGQANPPPPPGTPVATPKGQDKKGKPATQGQPPPPQNQDKKKGKPATQGQATPPQDQDKKKGKPVTQGQGTSPPQDQDKKKGKPATQGQGTPPPQDQDKKKGKPATQGQGTPPPQDQDKKKGKPATQGQATPPQDQDKKKGKPATQGQATPPQDQDKKKGKPAATPNGKGQAQGSAKGTPAATPKGTV
jgi:hypothetical protein